MVSNDKHTQGGIRDGYFDERRNGAAVDNGNTLLSAALAYAEMGWHVLPIHAPVGRGCSCFKKDCRHVGKHPRVKGGWKAATTDPEQIITWFEKWPESNLAIATGPPSGLMALDIDGQLGIQSLLALEKEYGPLPPTIVADTGKGFHLYFDYPISGAKSSAGEIAEGLDIRGQGGYIICPPSKHYSGKYYSWREGHDPDQVALATASTWLVDRAALRKTPKSSLRSASYKNGHAVASDPQNHMIPIGQRNSFLASLAGTMRKRGMSEEAILAALLEENAERCEDPLDVNEVKAIAKSISRYEPAAKKFPRTDLGNAELFAVLNMDTLRHDHQQGEWNTWCEYRWESDKSESVIQRAKSCARYRYDNASSIENLDERKKESQWAINSESRSRIESMLKLARSEPTIAVPKGTKWNTDPMLLAVGNGVVDLNTGRLHPGDPKNLISLHTPVHHNPKATCPRWRKFISEVLNNDKGLIRFVRKSLGYSITGLTREQIYFILYGHGSNGKSLFINVLRQVLGSYSHAAPFSVLEQRQGSQTNDVAGLVDKRFVTATETRKNTMFDEARLKQLTGSDPVPARFLYREYFTFMPQLKLWLAVNHLPKVHDQSYAFWRRTRLIPFEVRFAGHNIDKDLEQKLLAEKEGILSWLIDSLLLYLKEGLDPPATVLNAMQQYKTESDPLGNFLVDRCVIGAGQKVGGNQFYEGYKDWAKSNGDENSLNSVKFGKEMALRFTKKRGSSGVAYEGIGLKV